MAPGMPDRKLSQPFRDARDGFAHLVGGTRVGKANELTAVNRVEIDPGGSRDARLFQHLAGKGKTVGR